MQEIVQFDISTFNDALHNRLAEWRRKRQTQLAASIGKYLHTRGLAQFFSEGNDESSARILAIHEQQRLALRTEIEELLELFRAGHDDNRELARFIVNLAVKIDPSAEGARSSLVRLLARDVEYSEDTDCLISDIYALSLGDGVAGRSPVRIAMTPPAHRKKRKLGEASENSADVTPLPQPVPQLFVAPEPEPSPDAEQAPESWPTPQLEQEPESAPAQEPASSKFSLCDLELTFVCGFLQQASVAKKLARELKTRSIRYCTAARKPGAVPYARAVVVVERSVISAEWLARADVFAFVRNKAYFVTYEDLLVALSSRNMIEPGRIVSPSERLRAHTRSRASLSDADRVAFVRQTCDAVLQL